MHYSGPYSTITSGRPGKGTRSVKGLDGTRVLLFRVIVATVLLRLSPYVLGLTTAQAAPLSSQELLARAKAAEAKQDFVEAARCYTQYLSNNRDNPDVLQRLGLVYYLSNRFDAALPPLERALQLNPRLWGSALFLGISYYRTGQFERALDVLRRALESKPDLGEAHFWLGSSFAALGKNEEAALELEQVPAGTAERADADYLLVQSYQKAAESYYSRIDRISPDSARAHELQAESLAWRGNTQKAMLEYRKALDRNPSLEGAHAGLAELYWDLHRFEDARKEYEAETRNNPLDPDAQMRLGEYWTAQGNVSLAVQHLKAADQAGAHSAELYRALAQTDVLKGDFAQAESSLKNAIRIDPSEPASHRILAEVYRQTRRDALAQREEEVIRTLATHKPETGQQGQASPVKAQ